MSSSLKLAENALLYLEESIATRTIIALHIGINSSVFIGKNGHINQMRFVHCGMNNFIFIGSETLFAHESVLRSDSAHTMISINEKKALNSNKNIGVLIGDHVWLGTGVFLGPNTFIGSNSVLSARTCFINAVCPSCCLVKGNLPVIMRTGITYTGHRAVPCDPEGFDEIYSLIPKFENRWTARNMFDYIREWLAVNDITERIKFLKSVSSLPIAEKFVVPCILKKGDRPYSHSRYDAFVKLNLYSDRFVEKNSTLALRLPIHKLKLLAKLEKNLISFIEIPVFCVCDGLGKYFFLGRYGERSVLC